MAEILLFLFQFFIGVILAGLVIFAILLVIAGLIASLKGMANWVRNQ